MRPVFERLRSFEAVEEQIRAIWEELGRAYERIAVDIIRQDTARFLAQIGTPAVADSPAKNRWTYPITEVVKTDSGYSGFTAKAGGRTGTAYNVIEYMNDGSGKEGNGVTVSNLSSSQYDFDIQPAPAGLITWCWEVPLANSKDVEYWFCYENGVDGTCT